MRAARASVIVVVTAIVVGGCAGSGTTTRPTPLPRAPEPAVSPATAETPAGRIVIVAGQPEGVAVDAAAGIVAVAVRSPDGIVLINARSGAIVKVVHLEGAARHLALAGPEGPLLVPDETSDRLDEVGLPSGQLLQSIPVGRQPHDAADLGGRIFVSDELANTVDEIQGGVVVATLPAPLQPGGVATDNSAVVVVGVRARLVTAYDLEGTVIARAAGGAGPTHVVAGPGGYFYVADTNGGAILIYRLSGSSLRQVGRIAVGPAPYGLAYDAARGWLYVTLTGSNQLLGLHLRGTSLIARRSWPTGRQPNSVGVNEATGLIAVADAASDQLQLVSP